MADELGGIEEQLNKLLGSVDKAIKKSQDLEASILASIGNVPNASMGGGTSAPPPPAPDVPHRMPLDQRNFWTARPHGVHAVVNMGDIQRVETLVNEYTNPLLDSIRATDYNGNPKEALQEITKDLQTLNNDKALLNKAIKAAQAKINDTSLDEVTRSSMQTTQYELKEKKKQVDSAIAELNSHVAPLTKTFADTRKAETLAFVQQIDSSMMRNSNPMGGNLALQKYRKEIDARQLGADDMDSSDPARKVELDNIKLLTQHQRTAYDKSPMWQAAVKSMRTLNDPTTILSGKGSLTAQGNLEGVLNELKIRVSTETDATIVKLLTQKIGIVEKFLQNVGTSKSGAVRAAANVYQTAFTSPNIGAQVGTPAFHAAATSEYRGALDEMAVISQRNVPGKGTSTATNINYTKLSAEEIDSLTRELQRVATQKLGVMRASAAQYADESKKIFNESFDLGNFGGMKQSLNEMAQRKHEVQNMLAQAYKDPSDAGKGLYNLYKRELTELRMTEIEMKHMFAQELAKGANKNGRLGGDFGPQNSVENWMGNFGTAKTAVMKEFEERSGAIRAHWSQISNYMLMGGGALIGLVYQGTMIAAQFERTRVVFKNLVGDAGQANAIMSQMMAFSLKTPFKFTEITEMASQLIAAGYKTTELMPVMQSVIDAITAVGGDKATLDRVIYDFGKMKATGRIDAREMRTMAYARIPGWQMMAENYFDPMGNRPYYNEETKQADVHKLMADVSKRKIGQEGLDALQRGMDIKYGGVAEEVTTQTMQGRMEKFTERLSFAAVKLADSFLPIAKNILDAGNEFVKFISAPGMRELIVMLTTFAIKFLVIGGAIVKITLGVQQFLAFTRILAVTNALTTSFTMTTTTSAAGITTMGFAAAGAGVKLQGMALAMKTLQIAATWIGVLVAVLGVIYTISCAIDAQKKTSTILLSDEADALEKSADNHEKNANAIYRSIRAYEEIDKLVGKSKSQVELLEDAHKNLAKEIVNTTDKYGTLAQVMAMPLPDVKNMGIAVAEEEKRQKAMDDKAKAYTEAVNATINASGVSGDRAMNLKSEAARNALVRPEEYEGISGMGRDVSDAVANGSRSRAGVRAGNRARYVPEQDAINQRVTAYIKAGFSEKEAEKMDIEIENRRNDVAFSKMNDKDKLTELSKINRDKLQLLYERMEAEAKKGKYGGYKSATDALNDRNTLKTDIQAINTSLLSTSRAKDDSGHLPDPTTMIMPSEYGTHKVYDEIVDDAKMVNLQTDRDNAEKELKTAKENYLKASRGQAVVAREAFKIAKGAPDKVINGKTYHAGDTVPAMNAVTFTAARAGEDPSEEEKPFLETIKNKEASLNETNAALKELSEKRKTILVANAVRNLKINTDNLPMQQAAQNRRATAAKAGLSDLEAERTYDESGKETTPAIVRMMIEAKSEEVAVQEAINKRLEEKRQILIDTGDPLKVVNMLFKEVTNNAMRGANSFDVFAKNIESIQSVLGNSARMGTMNEDQIRQMQIMIEQMQSYSELLSSTRGLRSSVEGTQTHQIGFGFTTADDATKMLDEAEQVETKVYMASDRSAKSAQRFRENIKQLEDLKETIKKAGKVTTATVDAVREYNAVFKAMSDEQSQMGWVKSQEDSLKAMEGAWSNLTIAIMKSGGTVQSYMKTTLQNIKATIAQMKYDQDNFASIKESVSSEHDAEKGLDEARIEQTKVKPGDIIGKKQADAAVAKAQRAFDFAKRMSLMEFDHNRLMQEAITEDQKKREQERFDQKKAIAQQENKMVEDGFDINLKAATAYEERLKALHEGGVNDAIDAMGKIFGLGPEQQKWMKLGAEKQNKATREEYSSYGMGDLLPRYEEWGNNKVRHLDVQGGMGNILSGLAGRKYTGIGRMESAQSWNNQYQLPSQAPIVGPDGSVISPDAPNAYRLRPDQVNPGIKRADQAIKDATVILQQAGGAGNVQVGRLDIRASVDINMKGITEKMFQAIGTITDLGGAKAGGSK